MQANNKKKLNYKVRDVQKPIQASAAHMLDNESPLQTKD